MQQIPCEDDVCEASLDILHEWIINAHRLGALDTPSTNQMLSLIGAEPIPMH